MIRFQTHAERCSSFVFIIQMRGSQVIESARLHKMGFPESMSNVEFVRRFGLLGDSAAGSESLESILSNTDIDPATYRIGPSQVSV